MTTLATPTDLAVLSHRIRSEWEQTKGHQMEAWRGYLTVGALLTQARATFPADREYGRWFEEQEFGFGTEWGRRLMEVAENRSAVLEVLASALATGKRPPGVDALLALVTPPRQPSDNGASPPPLNYDPDHLSLDSVDIIVNYRVGPTPRREGSAHGSGPERNEWACSFPMQETAPRRGDDDAAFMLELVLHLRQKLQERPLTMMKR